VISSTDPHGRILVFYTGAAIISSKSLVNCTHEVEWTPFRTHLLTYSVALVRKRTIPTERPPLVGEVSANFCGFNFINDFNPLEPSGYYMYHQP
jgi:hypothetical protein